MTQEQKDKIISIIKSDAKIRHRYFDYVTGDCCIIGGLLEAAGFDKNKIKDLVYNKNAVNSCRYFSLKYEWSNPIYTEMEDKLLNLGISFELARDLQRINDSKSTREARQRDLIEYIMDCRLTRY
jgi:hypothetical protein